MDIPSVHEIESFIELKIFNEQFLTNLKKTIENKKKMFTMDFKKFTLIKDFMILKLKERGYSVQYCKHGEIYAIAWS